MTDLTAIKISSKRKPRRVYKPITPEGLKGCCDYLKQSMKGDAPDPALIVVGLDGSSIERAEVRFDAVDGTPMIAFIVEGRSPRMVDVPAFLYLRLLSAGGDYLWINDDSNGHHYLKLNIARPELKVIKRKRLSMTVLRLVGNAGPDHQVTQIHMKPKDGTGMLSHYDLRRRNLCSPAFALPSYDDPKRQRIKTDRAGAELAATKQFQKIKSRKAKLNIDGATFKRMLRDAASLIDKLPFGAAGRPT